MFLVIGKVDSTTHFVQHTWKVPTFLPRNWSGVADIRLFARNGLDETSSNVEDLLSNAERKQNEIGWVGLKAKQLKIRLTIDLHSHLFSSHEKSIWWFDVQKLTVLKSVHCIDNSSHQEIIHCPDTHFLRLKLLYVCFFLSITSQRDWPMKSISKIVVSSNFILL